MSYSILKCNVQGLLTKTSLVWKLMFRALGLKNCYIVNVNIPIYIQHVSLYFVWFFVIKCCQGCRQSAGGCHRVGLDVCIGMGNLFKWLGIWAFGAHFKVSCWFQNSIQTCN